MKIRNKIISAFVACVLAAISYTGIMPNIFPNFEMGIKVSAGDIRGKCGENIRWKLDSNGTLTISGTGDMITPNWLSDAPSFLGVSSKIKNVIIENGVSSISDVAFYGCSELKSVSIPDSVTRIEEGAFLSCINLQSIDIPDSVESIGESAFVGCENLKTLFIPDSVTSIGESAFSVCTSLESVTISNNVKIIEQETFSCCQNLKSVTIPYSVTKIGRWAFFDCSKLKDITIMNSNCIIHRDKGTICNEFGTNLGSKFNGIIHGYTNSTAQAYAKKHNYRFISMGTDPNMDPLEPVKETDVIGDANGDNALNVRDAANIAKYLSRGEAELLPSNADFNEDGKVDVRDAAAIAKFLSTNR